VFPSDLTDDPVIARGDKLVRWGAFVPTMGFCLVCLGGRLVISSRSAYVLVILVLTVVGQTLVWLGMGQLRRGRGWDAGVLFYLWVGGVLATVVAATSAILAVIPVPLLAPIVATFARWRAVRRTRRAAGVEA
jgi:hypothetical protein